MGGLDFVMKQNSNTKYKQTNKFSTYQLSEAGPASAIPYKLIIDIFSYFSEDDQIDKNINLENDSNMSKSI